VVAGAADVKSVNFHSSGVNHWVMKGLGPVGDFLIGARKGIWLHENPMPQ